MQLCIVRSILMIALVFDGTLASGKPFSIGGDARVDPADFEITTFASGLDFPFGIAVLQDGSLLVGVNSPPLGGSFFGASGALLRLVDGDGDGVADSEGDLLYTGLPRFTTSVRLAGNLIFVATGSPGIFVLRQGATPASLLTLEGWRHGMRFWTRRSEGWGINPGSAVPRVALTWTNRARSARPELVQLPRVVTSRVTTTV